MSRRIGKHVRSNVVGYVAVFLALTGTAWALERNSVRSRHIVNGQVKGADVDEPSLKRLDADTVIGSAGPLPVEGSFTSQGGDLLIIASGCGRRNAGPVMGNGDGLIGMDIKLDGTLVGVGQVFAPSEFDSDGHWTFTTDMRTVDASAGQHTIRLEEKDDAPCATGSASSTNYCTYTTSTDVFHVSAIELP